MKFCEKLSSLLERLDYSSKSLAKDAGIDPSLISRFKSGERIPRKDSKHIIRIGIAICKFTKEKGKENIIKETCHVVGYNFEREVCEWLRESELKDISKKKALMNRTSKRQLQDFGKKLDALMKIFNISNIKMAKSINVDASLISKFRTGSRIPSVKNQIIEDICKFVSQQPYADTQIDWLAEMLSIPNKDLIRDNKTLSKYIYIWFCEDKVQDIETISDFLAKINLYNSGLRNTYMVRTKPKKMGSKMALFEKYDGIDGLRLAAKKLLEYTLSQEEVRTLYVYSDQNLEWLYGDATFSREWAELLHQILLKGNKLKVIHNVERTNKEMFYNIEKWMPLYMTGNIESFYLQRMDNKHFAHTLLAAENLCAINSNCVVGQEDIAQNFLSTNPVYIKSYIKQFNELLKLTKPLMQVITTSEPNEKLRYVGHFYENAAEEKDFVTAPSLFNMPEDLFLDILKRNKVPRNLVERAKFAYAFRKKNFNDSLGRNKVIEVFTLYSDKELDDGVARINIAGIIGEDLYYTKKEYYEHLKCVLRLLKQRDNYAVVLLGSHPLGNVQIVSKQGVGVFVTANKKNSIALSFLHPMMCFFFEKYIDNFIGDVKVEKKRTIKLLEKYLED